MEQQAQSIARAAGSPMQVSCAWEGCEENVEGDGSGLAPARPLQRNGYVRRHRPRRILIVDDDEDMRILARKTLTRRLERDAGGEGRE